MTTETGHTVEGPKERKGLSNFSAWCRVVDADGSTVAYTPDHVTAARLAASPELETTLTELVEHLGQTHGSTLAMPGELRPLVLNAIEALTKSVPPKDK